MELSDVEFAKSADFIEQVSRDPTWLLTCLTCTDKNLNPNGELTYALWVYAGSLGCHTSTKQPDHCTEKMIRWLEEMKEAGAAVLFIDIPRDCFFPRSQQEITEEWRRYYTWLQTGVYRLKYMQLSGCDLPALRALFLAFKKEVLNATA